MAKARWDAPKYEKRRKPENDTPPPSERTGEELRAEALEKARSNALSWGEAYAYTKDGRTWQVTRMPPFDRTGKRELWKASKTMALQKLEIKKGKP